MGSHPDNICQDRKRDLFLMKKFIRQNEKLTDKMTLPLLDFLCCLLCTIFFLSFFVFLMLVYIWLYIKPASLPHARHLVWLN